MTMVSHKKLVKKNGLLQRLWRQRALQGMTWMGIIWMFIFCYIPMVGILIAFFSFDLSTPISEMEFVGLKYFREFLSDPRFFRALKNTLGLSFWKLVVGFPMPIFFALMLNEINSTKYKRVVQTVSYLPHFLSWAIFGGILLSWLSERGLFNQLFRALGMQKGFINYIARPQYYWFIAVASDVWKEMGWNAIIYIAAITAINPELFEAASIDGANRLQKMRHITLPSIKPTVAILFILAVSGMFGSNFNQTFVLRNSMNLKASETIDMYVYTMGLSKARYSYSTAMSLSLSLVGLLLMITANFVTKKLTEESLF